MKKRTAYCLNLQDEQTLLVKLQTAEETPYRVLGRETVPAGDPLPPRWQKDMAVRGSRTFLQLSNEDAFLLITSLPPMKRKQRLAALSAASARGVRPDGMIPGFLALDTLFRRYRPDGMPDGAWNLVYLGKDMRFLCVGDEGGLLFTRPLPEDLSGGAEREEYLERLGTEIERSNFFAQQAVRSMQVQSVVVCGEPRLADALTAGIAEAGSIVAVRWRPEDLFAGEVGENAAAELMPLAAAAAACGRPKYNLLPPSARKGPGKAVRRYALVAAAAFGLAVVPILLVGGLWTTRPQQAFLESAESLEDETRFRAQEAVGAYLLHQALDDRQQKVDRLGHGQPDLARLLEDIAARTPSSITYKSLDLNKDEEDDRYRLVLRGESASRDGLQAQQAFLSFLAALADCQRLEEIKEPTHLEIAGVEEDGTPESRVIFTLEYLVREGRLQ